MLRLVAWCLAAFFMHLRLLQYNPCSLVGDLRQHSLANSFWRSKFDLAVLSGTQLRCTEDEPARPFKFSKYRHLEFDHRLGIFVNRSAGISFLVGPRLMNAGKQTYVPGEVLQGRAAAVRLRADGPGLDLLVVAAYVPPCKSLPDMKYKKTYTAIFEWVHELLYKIGNRVLPIFINDLNDQLGLSRPGVSSTTAAQRSDYEKAQRRPAVHPAVVPVLQGLADPQAGGGEGAVPPQPAGQVVAHGAGEGYRVHRHAPGLVVGVPGGLGVYAQARPSSAAR